MSEYRFIGYGIFVVLVVIVVNLGLISIAMTDNLMNAIFAITFLIITDFAFILILIDLLNEVR